MDYPIRINKYLAVQGVASRREADALIEAQQVLVNGQPAVIGQKINATDTVEVLSTPKKRYLVYYKPRGVITHSPAADEVDIATKLKEDYGVSGVAPIGRLDKDSEGLIILSDDGRITGPLLDPEAGHEKEYEVEVDKPTNRWFARHLTEGVDIEGYRTKPSQVTLDSKHPTRFTITLTEGKKHQIRRMCAALGYQVTSLKRVRILDLTLDKLKPNQYRILKRPEVTRLLQQLALSSYHGNSPFQARSIK